MQPLTRPGALTDRPQRQRVSLTHPLGDQSAQPRSPVEPGGGTSAQPASRRPRPDHGRVKDNLSEVLVSSVLGVNLTRAEDYGAFTCSIRNVSSSSFTLWRAGPAGHVAAVLISLLVLLALLLAALLYVKCRLSVLRWYQDACGEVEMNDGKLYDAYVSYSDSPEDRKFVNFILKPHLERRRGYKLFLDDRDLLPRAGTAGPAPVPRPGPALPWPRPI
ncbi:single Ig IL-1-related receptor-like isoform X4 [Leptonychotes weddellii]|uniref:Single Ig IL-1-related receptor-like isoform X4 n=1 Tax=Leptonychotes weddellii TaxID=9713 RepID=A0A7F8Q7S1_LEPWE|nr:single Ig IL-1-related receptor-like isoform X4 [Leptonychotes weddellii]